MDHETKTCTTWPPGPTHTKYFMYYTRSQLYMATVVRTRYQFYTAGKYIVSVAQDITTISITYSYHTDISIRLTPVGTHTRHNNYIYHLFIQIHLSVTHMTYPSRYIYTSFQYPILMVHDLSIRTADLQNMEHQQTFDLQGFALCMGYSKALNYRHRQTGCRA